MSRKAPGMSLDWKEKIAYGLGGTASHFTFSMVTLYLMYFYTDVAGIGTAAVSIILLVMRIWDGINDPLMGVIIDKTKTKWGKCRPYFLWMAIPYGLVAVLLFTSPGFSTTGKIIWAFVTYFLYDIIYTAINLPLAAVLPMMTENSHERTVLNAVRMFLCMVGTIIVTLFTLKLVNLFGKGDASKGFLFTMILFGALSVVMWLFTFSSVKERVTIGTEKKEKIRLRESIKAIAKNPPWWILLGINVITWIGMTMQQGTAIYFFKYNLQQPALAPVFMTVSALCTLLGIVIVPSITKKLGKRKTFIAGNLVSVFGLLIIAIGGRYSVPLMFVGAFFGYCGSGAGTPLIYSLLADTVEYGEWKSGVRAEGLIFSASSFGVKFGMGLGSAITALMLTYGNYIANTVQTESSLNAIRFSYLYIPIACTLCVTLLLLFYRLNEKQYEAIKEELIQRRGVVEASTPMMD